MDTTTAHHHVRLRITELLRAATAEDADRVVPACPAWTVQQLASHVVGVSADIVAGNLAGAGSDPWTEAQVAARAGRSLAELAHEWDAVGAGVEAAAPDGTLPAQAVFDEVTHEHDLRDALGRPGFRDCPAVAVGLTFVEEVWPLVVGTYDVPPLRIVAGDAELVVGEDPDLTLQLTPFEALRALTGRRSPAQLAAYRWGVEPTPWLPAFTWGPFTPAETDIDVDRP